MKLEIGVFGLIQNENNEILLVHRTDHDLWDLPGGGTKDGESPWQAVIREVKEETGLGVEVVRLAGVFYRAETNIISFRFLCKVVGGSLENWDDEQDEVKYFALDNLPKNIIPSKEQHLQNMLTSNPACILDVHKGLTTKEFIKLHNL